MTRSVADGAVVLSIIAGRDPEDNFTLAQPVPVPDYVGALNVSALSGKRIGVPRAVFLDDTITGNDPYVNVVFVQALDTLRALGATVVDPANIPSAYAMLASKNETIVVDVDFKIQINAWFESLIANPSNVASLADLITFNDAHPDLEEPAGYTSQSYLLASEAISGYNAAFYEAQHSIKNSVGRRELMLL